MYTHGTFSSANGSTPFTDTKGVIGWQGNPAGLQHVYKGENYRPPFVIYFNNRETKGCRRDPSRPWFLQPAPWWTAFFLVPIYSFCSSLSNLQSWRKWPQLLVMVAFSCSAYAANRVTSTVLPGRTDIVSAAGAFVIGCLGNVYSRVVRGTAFTSMVTGVLFLVPVRTSITSGP